MTNRSAKEALGYLTQLSASAARQMSFTFITPKGKSDLKIQYDNLQTAIAIVELWIKEHSK